jgi:hypothetical protein
MVTANLTELVFTEIDYNFTEIFFIEERAPFTAQNKRADLVFVYISSQLVAKVTLYIFIVLCRRGVYIDFPTDTAIVFTFISDTSEIFAISRHFTKHINHLQFILIILS